MNSCILMAEIIQEPQLRYTPDTQMAIAEMVVEFPGIRDDDPPAQLKVVGWGNLAQEIQENYHQGDRVIVEGRLHMNSIDRPEGFKEKRAELTAQRIHRIGTDATLTTNAVAPTPTTASAPARQAPKPAASKPSSSRSGASESARTPAYSTSAPSAEPMDYDDIPF